MGNLEPSAPCADHVGSPCRFRLWPDAAADSRLAHKDAEPADTRSRYPLSHHCLPQMAARQRSPLRTKLIRGLVQVSLPGPAIMVELPELVKAAPKPGLRRRAQDTRNSRDLDGQLPAAEAGQAPMAAIQG